MAKNDKKKKNGKGKLKVEENKDGKVSDIGHNSEHNIVKQAIAEMLDCHAQKKEISVVEKSIKGGLKENNVSITAFNHILRVAKMDEEVAQNFVQDCRILFEAIDMQDSFDFKEDADPADAPDALEAAEAAANG